MSWVSRENLYFVVSCGFILRVVEQFAQGDSEVSVLGDAETWLELIPEGFI